MKRKKILFVCMGNICRSPAAEGVFKSFVKDEGFEDFFEIDSCGTIGYHSGEQPDERMKNHARKRGYNLVHAARKFNPMRDFDYFDYIITMDDANFANIKQLAKNERHLIKVHKLVEFNRKINAPTVPDPYYGGSRGFENVLDILEDASHGLIEQFKGEFGK